MTLPISLFVKILIFNSVFNEINYFSTARFLSSKIYKYSLFFLYIWYIFSFMLKFIWDHIISFIVCENKLLIRYLMKSIKALRILKMNSENTNLENRQLKQILRPKPKSRSVLELAGYFALLAWQSPKCLKCTVCMISWLEIPDQNSIFWQQFHCEYCISFICVIFYVNILFFIRCSWRKINKINTCSFF